MISGWLAYLKSKINKLRQFAVLWQPGANVRLCLLSLKGIDIASHQHRSQHQVFQNLNPLGRAGFIVLLERLVEILIRLLPISCIRDIGTW
jgi:hypothetical protein